MAEDGAAQSGTTQAWPLPSFYFKVSVTDVGDISCSEEDREIQRRHRL